MKRETITNIERKIIAIDNGKMNLKAKDAEKEICYANNYSKELTDDENLLGEYTYNATYKNKNYTIGENAKTSDKNEGKASEIQIVQALTAVTNFIEPECNKDIYLLYGESVDMYFNNKHKIDIKTKLEGKHTIYVNGVAYNFNIEYVQILPEGIGHILEDYDKTQGENYSGFQNVVDIGGGTINFLTVINGRPESESSRSFLLGVNNIIAKVQKKLKRTTFGHYPDKLLKQFITSGECPNIEMQRIIDALIIEQLEELDDLLSIEEINIHKLLKSQPVMFVGGGSEMLKNQINKYYRSEVIDDLVVQDALMVNVRGFYAYGVDKFSN